MRRVLEEAEALVQKHLAEVDGFDHVDVLNAASRIAFAKFDNNNIKTKTTGPNMHLSSAYLPLQHQEKEMKLSLPHWIQYSPPSKKIRQRNLKE